MKKKLETKVTTFSQCRIAGYLELSDEAKKYYEKKCRELIQLGLLRTTFLQPLLMWADNYAMYWQLRKEVTAEGSTFKTHNRYGDEVISANPKVKMMNDALKQANALAAEFGMTPKASKRLKSEEAHNEKSALDVFNETYGG